MSSHRISGCVNTDERELVNLRRGLPHPLPMPPALPPIWQDHVAKAHGYAFRWGHLVELPNGLEDPVTPCGGGITWRLLPCSAWVDLKTRARAARCRWSRILKQEHLFSAALLAERAPVWIVCRDARPCFLGEMVTVGRPDAERARSWLVDRFLRCDIDEIIQSYRDELLKSIAREFEFNHQHPAEEVSQ